VLSCVYIAAIILTWVPNLLFCPFHIFLSSTRWIIVEPHSYHVILTLCCIIHFNHLGVSITAGLPRKQKPLIFLHCWWNVCEFLWVFKISLSCLQNRNANILVLRYTNNLREKNELMLSEQRELQHSQSDASWASLSWVNCEHDIMCVHSYLLCSFYNTKVEATCNPLMLLEISFTIIRMLPHSLLHHNYRECYHILW